MSSMIKGWMPADIAANVFGIPRSKLQARLVGGRHGHGKEPGPKASVPYS